MKGLPNSFKELKVVSDPDTSTRPEGASNVQLERTDGTRFWLTHGVTDRADGVTAADFDFAAGKAEAKALADAA